MGNGFVRMDLNTKMGQHQMDKWLIRISSALQKQSFSQDCYHQQMIFHFFTVSMFDLLINGKQILQDDALKEFKCVFFFKRPLGNYLSLTTFSLFTVKALLSFQ